jgi:hypothetical protein
MHRLVVNPNLGALTYGEAAALAASPFSAVANAFMRLWYAHPFHAAIAPYHSDFGVRAAQALRRWYGVDRQRRTFQEALADFGLSGLSGPKITYWEGGTRALPLRVPPTPRVLRPVPPASGRSGPPQIRYWDGGTLATPVPGSSIGYGAATNAQQAQNYSLCDPRRDRYCAAAAYGFSPSGAAYR